jgi:hypothetical protein
MLHVCVYALYNQDGDNPTLTWLSRLFRDRLPVPAPKVQCAACKNGHTRGECPFRIVSEEVVRNHENRNHPAVSYIYDLYHDFYPKHCMICNDTNHSTHKGPNDYMRYIKMVAQVTYQ